MFKPHPGTYLMVQHIISLMFQVSCEKQTAHFDFVRQEHFITFEMQEQRPNKQLLKLNKVNKTKRVFNMGSFLALFSI